MITTRRRGRAIIYSYPSGTQVVITYPSRWRAFLAHRFLRNG